MNFPNPFRWAGKNIRTFHLDKSRTVVMRNKHLQYQEADRKSVSMGARRKVSCVLRKRHISRAFSRRLFLWMALRFVMQPSVWWHCVRGDRFPLKGGNFVPKCTLTCTLHARLCPSLPCARRASRPILLEPPSRSGG